MPTSTRFETIRVYSNCSFVDQLVGAVIGHQRALIASFALQWKQLLPDLGSLSIFLIFIPYMAIIGWIVGRSSDPAVLTFVTFGAIFFTIWHLTSYRAGHALQEEFMNQTIDQMLIAPTPLAVIILGRVLAIVAVAAISTPISFIVFTMVAGGLPQISNPALFGVSVLLVSVTLIIVSFFFSPLYVLSGGGRGYVNAVAPFGVVFSGFLYPIDLLPVYLEAVAWVFPTSWGMDAVIMAGLGHGLTSEILFNWLMAAALSAAWLSVTLWMFKKVESRARSSGMLGRV